MSRFAVIAGFGGINAAGRASFHHAFQRMVIDALPAAVQEETLRGLATLTRRRSGDFTLDAALRRELLDASCMRRIEPAYFDTEAIACNRRATLHGRQAPIRVTLRRRDLPETLPANWSLGTSHDDEVEVLINGDIDVLLPSTRKAGVRAAGQVPSGFDPAALYPSHHHPRTLQLAVFAASDALHASGLDWDQLRDALPPDAFAVYAASAISQLDEHGLGGLLRAGHNGKRPTSKQMALGIGEMPADFINAYVLGSIGATAGLLGACATFLYNLEKGIRDIESGRRRVVIVGASDAPLLPEVFEAFRAMSALGEDADLLALDPDRSEPDFRRAVRPFSTNIGFALAESAQYVVLLDDELALELGADIHGIASEVFVHADGWKKSISAPGAGNYLTMGKAAAWVRRTLGEDTLREKSFLHAHGTSTPQNRTSESHVFNETAKAFGIQRWPVTAIKCFLGHPMGAASGDQVTAALGTFAHGIIPGITTIDHIAADVHCSHLDISWQHRAVGHEGMDVSFVNAKGFGGNNATGVLLAPHVARQLLRGKHGNAAMDAWQQRREGVAATAQAYGQRALSGEFTPRYRFGTGVIDGKDVRVTDREVTLPGFARPVSLGN